MFYRLIDTFPVFLEQQLMEDVSGLGIKFKSSMPKAITLRYVVDVWKRIVMHDTQAVDK